MFTVRCFADFVDIFHVAEIFTSKYNRVNGA